MSMASKFALALAATGLLALSAAQAAETAGKGRECFLSRNWDGWTAPGDGDVLYLGVRTHEVWRVDLVKGSHVHKDGDTFLVNRLRGSSYVCSPLDLDLTLNDHFGMRRGLIATSLRKLTPEEVAALPKKDRPY